MQHQDQSPGTPPALTHPAPEEWMGFLYDECSPEQRRTLQDHLDRCPVCTGQINVWRQTMRQLDDWRPVAFPRARPRWNVAAIAAAVVFLLASVYLLGRLTARAEIRNLQASVARLETLIQSTPTAESNLLAVATSAAGAETTRLIAEYARLTSAQRASDEETWKLSLDRIDRRLTGVESDLQTVAVNTEQSFRQTRQNLVRLASLSSPVSGGLHQEP